MFEILVLVIPAEAGIQASIQHLHPAWMPVFTGMTELLRRGLSPPPCIS